MEASTQPLPATPDPTPVIPTTPEIKKNSLPLIISLVLFFVVVIVLVILFLMSRNNGTPTNTQSTVSAPVVQTTAAPETSGDTAAPTAVPDTSTNTFEARLFYLGFDYKNALTSDSTSRITYADGTTQCFEEIAAGDGITLNVYNGDTACTGVTTRLPDGESFDLVSKDSKTFNFTITQDSVGNFTAIGVFATSDPSNYLIKIEIDGTSLEDAKANATSVIKTLVFDTSKLKTELTDNITQNASGT